MLNKYDLQLLYQLGVFLSVICAVIILSAKAAGFLSWWVFPVFGPLFGFIAVLLMLFLAFIMSVTALFLLIKSSGIAGKYGTLFIVLNLFITITGIALILCILLSPYIKACDEFTVLVFNLFLSAPDGVKFFTTGKMFY